MRTDPAPRGTRRGARRGARPARRWSVALGPLLGAAALAGCGPPVVTTTVSNSIVAPSGLRYMIVLTERGDQACSTERYAVAGVRVKNFPQTIRFCGPVGENAPPRLIQVARPAAALIVDRPTRCGPVAVGRGRARPVAASSKCNLTSPHLRLTLLPSGRLLTVAGIAGVRRLVLGGRRCSFICTRALPVAAAR